jgi:quinoprotein dehydrogenase-associated probable ABC transporter substrate-binding protein
MIDLRRSLCCGLLLWLVSAAAPAWDGSTVKVCADPNNPPYSDKKGDGFENKIAEMLGKSLGKKVEYTWFPQRLGFIRNTLKAQLPDSDEYKCDVVIGVPAGYELTATTEPYYRSTYALIYAKKRGWDDIKSPEDLVKLPAERRSKLKLAMFDGSPATDWLLKHDFVQFAIPYQTMTGDASVNTAMILDKDMKEGKLDMAIVWGPIAGYLQYHNKPGLFELIPMRSGDGIRFDFPMSMGVRIPDKARKQELDQWLKEVAPRIQTLLNEYKVPLVDKDGAPLPAAGH